MKRCSRCVLPETFPGIEFNGRGVCNYCRRSKSSERLSKTMKKYREKFEKLISENKTRGGYDAIMAFSGGKDSTYTMFVLKKEYDLSILALTMDNGFVSPKSLDNCRKVVEGLGIDHLIFKPRIDILSTLFRKAEEEDFFASRKGLERASTICTTCMSIVKFIALRRAIEGGIPFIFYGWSPGQAPVEASIFRNNPAMIEQMQAAMLEPMREIAGEEVENYFLTGKHFQMAGRFPYNISPLAFLEYDEDKIMEQIKEFGWERPDDTDPNSTNCLLNALGIRAHIDRHHFHPYAFELAGLVRNGYMKREEAIQRLEEKPSRRIISAVTEKLARYE
ncbi:MAG: 7-cyano-7-deazaguanine synthase [Candidatus Krumholzibacteriota bacterium]